MKKMFSFNYYLTEGDFITLFDNNICKKQLEENVANSIIKAKFVEDDSFWVGLDDDLQVSFTIVDKTDNEYTVDIEDIWSMKEYLGEK